MPARARPSPLPCARERRVFKRAMRACKGKFHGFSSANHTAAAAAMEREQRSSDFTVRTVCLIRHTWNVNRLQHTRLPRVTCVR